jgi:hypothetical protein
MQTCLICGPDVDCKGHPEKRQRSAPEALHVTAACCPICENISDAPKTRGRHRLGGAVQINRALTLGPVYCHLAKHERTPFGELNVDDDFVVTGARTRNGHLELNTAAGWLYSFCEIWAECTPTPYAGKR